MTIPGTAAANIDQILCDRFAFDATPFADRLRGASEVWIFAPSAINILSAHYCEILRSEVLNRPGGTVRVVVLDPDNASAVDLAVRQLDDSLDYPLQDFRASLQATVHQLRVMSSWEAEGSIGYRFLDYNPGFSLVAIDPAASNGRIVVEFHGFHNKATSSRMHIEVSRQHSERWYSYWMDQFKSIWEAASAAVDPDSPAGTQ
jgi:hypothetical protein